MMNRCYLLLFTVLFCFQFDAKAQLNIQPNVYRLKTHYAYIAAHHEFVEFFQTSHFPIFEVSIGNQCNGEKSWHQQYNFPVNGVGVHYIDFQNTHLGRLYSLFYFINIPLIEAKKFSFNFDFSSGLAYHNEIFNPDKNHYNTLISTRLNGIFNIELNFNYQITKKMILEAGADLTHSSNGLISAPNFGINMFAVNFGLNYIPEERNIAYRDQFPEYQKHNDLLLSFSGGYKDLFLKGKYGVYALSADYGRHIGYRLRPGIGFEVFYDGSLRLRLEEDNQNGDAFFNKTRYVAFVSNYLKFGNFAIITQPGIIVYSPSRTSYQAFQNIGFLYYMTPKLYLRVLLRSHSFTADFIEWGLCYQIGNSPNGFGFIY